MKSFRLLTIVIASTLFCGCGQVANKKMAAVEEADSVAVEEGDYHLDFPQYGFSIDAPCVLQDVSTQASGDFLVNYGGVTDGNSREKMAAYQLIVTRAPIGYRDLPKKEYEKLVDEALRAQVQKFNSYKAIRFSYDEYPGYACETTHNGYGQKGVMFAMDNFIIGLTVISNNNLDAKFNKFTNGFKRLPSNN